MGTFRYAINESQKTYFEMGKDLTLFHLPNESQRVKFESYDKLLWCVTECLAKFDDHLLIVQVANDLWTLSHKGQGEIWEIDDEFSEIHLKGLLQVGSRYDL